jgi:photosystem II stability/assembly factor-like uncharacterized protein
MRKLWSVLLFTAFIVSIPAGAGWTRAGLYGADVRALVIDPQNADHFYLGTSQGEVYVSRDAGANWKNPRVSTPFPGYVVDNLIIDARGRLWVAAWGLWGGGVIAVSNDHGLTWSRRDAGLENFSVRAIVIDPSNNDRVVVGGLDGVHLSEDSGKTWRRISDQTNVESLAIDPRNSDTIFVGTWRQAWRSDDGGQTWKHIANGMVLDTDVFTIQINPKNPDSVWVSTCGWVYNSADRGDTWVRYREGFKNRRIHDVKIDPRSDDLVYAASVAGLYRTKDAGKNWELISDEGLVINAIGVHPERPGRIVLGTEGDGVYVSDDDGATYRRISNGLYNVKVAGVVSDPDKKGRLYAAVFFGGSASGIYESLDGGEGWRKISTTKLPEVLTFLVRSGEGPRFIAGTEKGFYWSGDGREWTLAEPVTNPLRVDRILAYNSTRLFAATGEGVYTSKDSGQSWYRLSNLADRTVDIALGRVGTKRALYAMTNSGLTLFDGEKWISVKGAPAKGKQIAVRNDGDAELVIVGSLQGVRAGRIDADGNWLDTTMPAGPFIEVHQASRKNDNLLFLAAKDQRDLMISTVGNTSWKPLSAPLDPMGIVHVTSDFFDEKTLYFGTHGQGVYIYRPDDAKAAKVHVPPAGSK